MEKFCREYEEKMLKFDEKYLEIFKAKENLEIFNNELKKEKDILAKKVDSSRQQLMIVSNIFK